MVYWKRLLRGAGPTKCLLEGWDLSVHFPSRARNSETVKEIIWLWLSINNIEWAYCSVQRRKRRASGRETRISRAWCNYDSMGWLFLLVRVKFLHCYFSSVSSIMGVEHFVPSFLRWYFWEVNPEILSTAGRTEKRFFKLSTAWKYDSITKSDFFKKTYYIHLKICLVKFLRLPNSFVTSNFWYS